MENSCFIPAGRLVATLIMDYTGEMFAKFGREGKLALSWPNDENWSAMLFSPIIYGL